MKSVKKIISYVLVGFSFLSLLGVFAILGESLFGSLFFLFFVLLFGWLAFKLNPITKQNMSEWNADIKAEFSKFSLGIKKFFNTVKYEFEQSKLAAQRRVQQQSITPTNRPIVQSQSSPEYEITYTDIDGNYSIRQIDIERVYRKSGRIYVDAYCYLMADTRTFRVDRIMSMKYRSNDELINNVSLFFKSRL